MSSPRQSYTVVDSPIQARHGSSYLPYPDVQLPATTNPPGPQNPPQQAVWLIFGATGHFGRFIVDAALKHGDRICAVGKAYSDNLSTIQAWHSDTERYLGLLCDVRSRKTVQNVIDQTMKKFGAIDIIVNCAGCGVVGSCEDQDEHEIRNQFETNFMGTLNIIQLSMPYFRERQDGRYLIFSSISGALGVPGIGPFCATKNAVEGLVESMVYEVDGFNVRFTLIEPGHIRRDQVEGAEKIPKFGHFRVAKPSEPYEGKDAPAEHWKRIMQWIGDHSPTSALRSAELIWQLGHCSYPPLRLLLGSYAVDSIRDRLKSIIEEIEDWKHLSFPPFEGQEQDPDNDDGDHDHDHDNDHDQDDHDHDDEQEHDFEQGTMAGTDATKATRATSSTLFDHNVKMGNE